MPRGIERARDAHSPPRPRAESIPHIERDCRARSFLSRSTRNTRILPDPPESQEVEGEISDSSCGHLTFASQAFDILGLGLK